MALNGHCDLRPNRIFLWANPRTLSTAFEKCISFIDGAQIWHEPFVSCYLNLLFTNPDTLAKFPKLGNFLEQFGKAKAILDAGGHTFQGGNLQPATKFSHDWVKEQLEKPLEKGKTFMFIKDMAFGIDGYYDKLPEASINKQWCNEDKRCPGVPVKHTFIIRNTHRQALSARRLLIHLYDFKGDPDDFDLGTDHPFMEWEKLSSDPLFKWWNYVREYIDPNPIVIDADDLQNYPEAIMTKYCEKVGIPFKKENLQWDGSDKSLRNYYGSLEQLVWGQNEHIYDAAFLSSSFLPIDRDPVAILPQGCQNYEQEFREGYRVMYKTRIRPDE
ncbi:hypothetical protein HOLleu_14622 [Holothuria leucospilota]|uniref:Sulfotransferase n=1 Tax=Holothuria leucospilota TaxID=206669 RepID=A0A9Q1C8W0_HOLLE|nr:hypothetical protein HOLleu_14622 [Holothuria leucospilota]